MHFTALAVPCVALALLFTSSTFASPRKFTDLRGTANLAEQRGSIFANDGSTCLVGNPDGDTTSWASCGSLDNPKPPQGGVWIIEMGEPDAGNNSDRVGFRNEDALPNQKRWLMSWPPGDARVTKIQPWRQGWENWVMILLDLDANGNQAMYMQCAHGSQFMFKDGNAAGHARLGDFPPSTRFFWVSHG